MVVVLPWVLLLAKVPPLLLVFEPLALPLQHHRRWVQIPCRMRVQIPVLHHLISSSCPLLFVFGWIAQFAQFPDQINPPQSLVLLRLPANEQPFCAARSWYSFLDELGSLRSGEINKMPARREGFPWSAGGWVVAGSAMSWPLWFSVEPRSGNARFHLARMPV